MLQDIVMREAMVMRQQRHPNVLPLLAAFLSEAVLWMVMPYVAGGSAIHILNKRCPGVRTCSSCPLHTCTTCTATLLSHSGCVHSFCPFGPVSLHAADFVMGSAAYPSCVCIICHAQSRHASVHAHLTVATVCMLSLKS